MQAFVAASLKDGAGSPDAIDTPSFKSFFREDEYLDAILDVFTSYPSMDFPSILALATETLETPAEPTTKEQREQDLEREAMGQQLRHEWFAATEEATVTCPLTSDLEARVVEITEKTINFLDSLHDTEASSEAADGWSAGGRIMPPPAPQPSLSTAAQALEPLLRYLSRDHPSGEITSTELRTAYCRLLPSLLAVAARALTLSASSNSNLTLTGGALDTSSSVFTWYGGYVHDDAVRQMLSPYVVSVIGPSEKELRFHFRPGRASAAIQDPQHFFSFLMDCLERQQRSASQMWAKFVDAESVEVHAAFQQVHCVSQLMFCATAVVVFQECYRWHPSSPLWRLPDYVVVTVNAVLDFLVHSEGQLCREAAGLVMDHLLMEDAFIRYTRAGSEMATAALGNGANRLWRQAFLTDGGGATSFPLYSDALHMVRSLEALLRRLLHSPLFAADRYGKMFWSHTVEPSLARFFRTVEVQVPSAEAETLASWDLVLTLLWYAATVHLVAAAAEDWLGMLCEYSVPALDYPGISGDSGHAAVSPAPASTDALDGLVLFRDQLARRAADHARRLTRYICAADRGASAQAVGLLYSLDDFLRSLTKLPDETSSPYIVQAVVASAMRDGLSQEQRSEMIPFMKNNGLLLAAQLLTA